MSWKNYIPVSEHHLFDEDFDEGHVLKPVVASRPVEQVRLSSKNRADMYLHIMLGHVLGDPLYHLKNFAKSRLPLNSKLSSEEYGDVILKYYDNKLIEFASKGFSGGEAHNSAIYHSYSKVLELYNLER